MAEAARTDHDQINFLFPYVIDDLSGGVAALEYRTGSQTKALQGIDRGVEQLLSCPFFLCLESGFASINQSTG